MAQHFAGTRTLAFAIRTSRIQGKGAFATRRIRKGERIIEYLGECIDEAESDIRYPDDEMGRHHTFLFSIGDGSRVLDAGPLDWPAKYINHSCDPNCEAIEEEDGRVFISALRKIEVGTELLYDYAYERTDDHTDADEVLYACRCGSPKCRGSILAPLTAKEEKKAKKRKEKEKTDKEKQKGGKDKKKQKKEKNTKDAVTDAAPAPAVEASAEMTTPARATRRNAPSRKKSGTERGAKKGTKAGAKRRVKTTKRTKPGTKAHR